MKENPEFWVADLHGHTTFSVDATYDLAETLKRAEAANLDIVAITDHDDMQSAIAVHESLGSTFIPGEEVSTNQGHVIALFPESIPKQPIPKGYSFEDTVAMIHDEGGLVIIAHVGLGWKSPLPISVRLNRIRRFIHAGGRIDGIEVMNTYFRDENERNARNLAQELHLAEVGVGDDHVGNIGRTFNTLVPKYTGDPKIDLPRALQKRETIAVRSALEPFPVENQLPRHVRAIAGGLSENVSSAPVFLSTWGRLRMEDINKRMALVYGDK